MPRIISKIQENYSKGMPLVFIRTLNLHKSVRGHQRTTTPMDNVPGMIIVGEICYQTILQGYNATLVKYKKRDFIPQDFHIGFYLVKYTAQEKLEWMSQLEFRFPIG